jgi:hypothetical protein
MRKSGIVSFCTLVITEVFRFIFGQREHSILQDSIDSRIRNVEQDINIDRNW